MPGINPPPFSFWRPKKKTAVEPSKEKTLVAAQLRARDAPCRAAGCGAKLFCSVDAAPTGARAGLLSDFRTFCAVLHSEGIGQRSNLTSCSFRAFRFAKRCRGGRGGLPLFDGLCADSRLLLVTAAQTLRCASLAWVVAAAIPLFRRGRRPRRPEPLSIVKRTDSHGQCAHWPRNDRKRLSLRGGPQGRRGNPHPRPKAPLCKGSCQPQP